MEKQKKGKNEFTQKAINEIERLIEQKLKAPSNKQKSIRDDIRKIGFYWTDFHPREEKPKVKYNVENFRKLIDSEFEHKGDKYILKQDKNK